MSADFRSAPFANGDWDQVFLNARSHFLDPLEVAGRRGGWGSPVGFSVNGELHDCAAGRSVASKEDSGNSCSRSIHAASRVEAGGLPEGLGIKGVR